MDKKFETLQTATKGKGIDLVLMGDAFTDIDIETGFYKQLMEFAMESFFTIEPTKSYREYFNVYMVYAVSRDAYIGEYPDHVALGDNGPIPRIKQLVIYLIRLCVSADRRCKHTLCFSRRERH